MSDIENPYMVYVNNILPLFQEFFDLYVSNNNNNTSNSAHITYGEAKALCLFSLFYYSLSNSNGDEKKSKEVLRRIYLSSIADMLSSNKGYGGEEASIIKKLYREVREYRKKGDISIFLSIIESFSKEFESLEKENTFLLDEGLEKPFISAIHKYIDPYHYTFLKGYLSSLPKNQQPKLPTPLNTRASLTN